MSTSPTYQHVVACGLPYDRGYAHGSQAAAKVQRNVEYYRQAGRLAESGMVQKLIREIYIPNITAHYPSGWEEMKGIADGASVSVEDVVLLNARYDLSRLNGLSVSEPQSQAQESDEDAHECTTAFFLAPTTDGGDVLNAVNWDMNARLWHDDVVIYLEIHPHSSESKPSLFLAAEAGQLGRSGMNSLGIGVTSNSLMSTEDYIPDADATRPVMPISLLRRMILECSHLSEAMTATQQFPRHVSNGLTLATAEGFGLCLELTPSRVYKVYSPVDDAYLVHTNHFTDPSFLAGEAVYDRYPGGSSWFRRQRLEQGIRPYVRGRVTAPQLVQAFSDHLSFPESLCCHPDQHPPDSVIRTLPGYPYRSNAATVACLIYNLSQRTIWACKGPPCHGTFETFTLKGPRSLTRPTGDAVEPGEELRPEIP
ncbi:acyl-coenzyme A:6-aminopenicillanic acid acyl-transferase-domain-containing protein [Aspergillus avenaceus]|uniref:Acyl-coenzyme A:6-aminopenicillanic acid acyl-transferase-domain-containing protein n=1 Tax=Aspergillus avenaceus TaxID=36643 RepID=A0A5N6TYZ6_ASPAV|nr:acyl-coenzyme A:6-aminopenicillanic acid acyl-transferase-domain-containing protein [Aspergillus avenaceus]